MDDPELDPELDKLLNDLEKVDAENKKQQHQPNQPMKLNDAPALPLQPPIQKKEPKKEPLKEVKVPPSKVEEVLKNTIDPTKEGVIIGAEVEEENEISIPDIIRDKIITFITGLIGDCDKDKSQVQEVIDFLRIRAEDDEARDSVIEQLVQSLRTKNEVNDTAIRAIDNLVKVLGIEKRGTSTKNTNNLYISETDLKKFLDGGK